jgi:hypothetical protein
MVFWQGEEQADADDEAFIDDSDNHSQGDMYLRRTPSPVFSRTPSDQSPSPLGSYSELDD